MERVTHADASRGGGVGFSQAFVCVSVCLVIHTISQKPIYSYRITKLNTQVFHHESWKCTHFGVKMSKVKVTRYKNNPGVGFCTLCRGIRCSPPFACFCWRYLKIDEDLAYTCPTNSPGNPFILSQKVKCQGHESTGMGLCTVMSAGFL